MQFVINIKDINALSDIEITAIYTRLSWPDSGSDSSIQKELDKRYLKKIGEPHPSMALALLWQDGVLVG